MKTSTTHPVTPFEPLTARELSHVQGGAEAETDWLNIGSGIAAGFCAFGPLAESGVIAARKIAARLRFL